MKGSRGGLFAPHQCIVKEGWPESPAMLSAMLVIGGVLAIAFFCIQVFWTGMFSPPPICNNTMSSLEDIVNLKNRTEQLSVEVAALRKQFVEAVSTKVAGELTNYRWKELRDLVEYLSVVGQIDVLGNIIASMRTHKKSADASIAKQAADEEKKREDTADAADALASLSTGAAAGISL